jgi:SAM-dependent methyltransferase
MAGNSSSIQVTQRSRFDHLSASYEELLRDPIRDRFTGAESIFFHRRKADLIRRFLARRGLLAQKFRYLDAGCGKGELLSLLCSDFKSAAGCDVSAEMMREITGVETRVQADPLQIPFGDGEFDFVTAVCVFHHVSPAARPALTTEIRRVLRPTGICCIIEHNPFNPVTRLIVSRTPVDADAILLAAAEAQDLVKRAGFRALEQDYFLYFPRSVYRYVGFLEAGLAKVPLGGQYALFAEKISAA